MMFGLALFICAVILELLLCYIPEIMLLGLVLLRHTSAFKVGVLRVRVCIRLGYLYRLLS